jgi:hypothetical protein
MTSLIISFPSRGNLPLPGETEAKTAGSPKDSNHGERTNRNTHPIHHKTAHIFQAPDDEKVVTAPPIGALAGDVIAPRAVGRNGHPIGSKRKCYSVQREI